VSAWIAASIMGNRELLCKLDMEKAYDHMDWKFLLYTFLGGVASGRNGVHG
jgi:hypothetical protein